METEAQNMNKILKNFFIGMGSVLSIMPTGGVAYIELPDKTDAENLKGDWERVGEDLRKSLNQMDNEQKK